MRTKASFAIDRLERIVRQIRYKPGWSFTIKTPHLACEYQFSIPLFVTGLFHRLGDNSTFVDQPITQVFEISSDSLLSGIPDEVIVENIRRAIVTLELHEVDEWLTFKGNNVREPHPERKEMRK